jgi:hypothetical protein
MHGLSAKDVLDIWERGAEATDVERGLLLLSYCYPEKSWVQLSVISIGRRDGMLLRLRQATLGSMLKAYALCPGCDCQLEFEANSTEFYRKANFDEADELLSFSEGPLFIGCRLPNSTDLQAVCNCSSIEEARRLIFSRCVTSIEGEDPDHSAEDLPEQIIERFSACLSEKEPEADIAFALECPSCSRRWSLTLDIVNFFWHEIQAAARRIVLEVDALARSYGWREADILNMSSVRRLWYLEMVG